jgi:hypothetical protein
MSLDPIQGFMFYTLGAPQSDAPRFAPRGADLKESMEIQAA